MTSSLGTIWSRTLMTAGIALFVGFGAVAPAAAQSTVNQLPDELEGLDIDEQLGEKLPLDLEFTDHTGALLQLGDLFEDDRPVILTPVFYECPMLCTITLNGLADGLNDSDMDPAKDFRIVSISFNPEETHELAEVKRRAYLTQYRHENAAEGWTFMTGDDVNIEQLLEAIGLKIRRLEDGSYAHPPLAIFVSPDGTMTRYMSDVKFEARDIDLALVEASDGAVGSPLDHLVLFFCFQYDPDKNSYVVAAWKVMRAGALLTVSLIAFGVVALNWWGPRHSSRLAARGVQS